MKKIFCPASLIIVVLAGFALYSTESFGQENTYSEEDLKFFEDDWDKEVDQTPAWDPWEDFNRKVFRFNDYLIQNLVTPATKGYNFLVPKKVQSVVDNFFTNLKSPVRFFNCIFQKKAHGASTELNRFIVNTSFGIGGLFDPARAEFGLRVQDEDFGQTLGVWGMKEGRYLMLPLFGPATTREVFGFLGDALINPLTWINVASFAEDDFRVIPSIQRMNNFSYRVLDNYKTFTKDALDPYIALQHAFIQLRRKKIEE